MTPDYLDMLRVLSEENVDFLVVGAHARSVHGTPRATGDLDIFIRRTPENVRKALEALRRFGAPLAEISEADLLEPETVFQIGVTPNRIDLLNDLSGVTFEEAWPQRTSALIGDLSIPVIGREAYLRNKRATGRLKDLADVEDVEGHPSQE
ncbi:MAG: nucleotidyltransferase [Candidatus Sericytochromatia bacterium]|nr:nucleotidyltransferase [Candidatus Sericytochromatia bacterium]